MIRSIQDLQSIPVVILTVSDLREDREETVQLGITKYIVKPMDFQEFVTEMGTGKRLFTDFVGAYLSNSV